MSADIYHEDLDEAAYPVETPIRNDSRLSAEEEAEFRKIERGLLGDEDNHETLDSRERSYRRFDELGSSVLSAADMDEFSQGQRNGAGSNGSEGLRQGRPRHVGVFDLEPNGPSDRRGNDSHQLAERGRDELGGGDREEMRARDSASRIYDGPTSRSSRARLDK